ncbi:ATP-binding protein [Rhizorhabdus wittichii]|uniref:ATP-binding protein n=1 Tax=Rhizorhabdus wittichii TaxID=160791 RepID=A0A975HGK5_9SPHN|nr:ATP-binding protein [Rhizorhabdus wittichii]QTH23039.1 ATP-binding protein [Rhizorhabdus wittichii]
MEPDLRGIAHKMARQRAAQAEFSQIEQGEAAHFAHAAARVLQALSVNQVKRCGEDLIDLIDREVPVAALHKLTNREKPSVAEMRAVARQLAAKRAAPTQLDSVFAWVGELFGLDPAEVTILTIFARWGKFECWRELVRRAPISCSNLTPSAVAQLSGLAGNTVERKLVSGAPLFSSRLLHDDRDGEYSLSPLLRRLIRVHAETRDEMLRWLMPEPEQGGLLWNDFEHLDPLRSIALKVLSSKEPVSILLFGEPGTGKTEFARTLATEAGSGAIFAGLSDDFGNEPDRSERLDHLMILRAMCRHHRDRVIVVDEADDVLMMSERKGSSKQWINRLVEAPQVSTIWIVNQRSRLDPAVLRRMTLAIGFDRPRLAVRERVAKRSAEAASVDLSNAELRDIACLKAPPAVVAAGLKAAHLANGGADVAKTAIHSVMRVLGQSCAPEAPGSSVYDPALSRADTDLSRLADRLAATPDRGWSLLLSGPSGTGKSAFARHLAEVMGLEIEERRCSDLMSPYVGETEQNIAEAFARAAERGALLLIDEVDSFLYRREAGQRSWEVSQVNEMLVQLEHLRTPFVATTNLADNLDPATQRRFTIRAAFNAMTPAQVSQLFKARFGLDWPVEWPVHHGQTPGDFTVVAHRANLLAERDPAVLVSWLRDEIEARGDQVRGKMGFHVTGDVLARSAVPVVPKAA